MKKERIDVFDYANEIAKALRRGVLLTTKNAERIPAHAGMPRDLQRKTGCVPAVG